jgi:hypothetical protein
VFISSSLHLTLWLTSKWQPSFPRLYRHLTIGLAVNAACSSIRHIKLTAQCYNGATHGLLSILGDNPHLRQVALSCIALCTLVGVIFYHKSSARSCLYAVEYMLLNFSCSYNFALKPGAKVVPIPSPSESTTLSMPLSNHVLPSFEASHFPPSTGCSPSALKLPSSYALRKPKI